MPSEHPSAPTTDAGRRRAFATLAVLALGFAALWVAWPMKGPLAFAVVFAYLLQRPHERLRRWVRKPWASGAILTLGMAVAIVAPFAIGGALVAREARAAVEGGLHAEGVASGAAAVASRLGVPEERARETLQSGMERLGAAAAQRAPDAAVFAGGLLVDFLIFLLLLYFLVVGWGRLRGFVSGVLPYGERDRDELYARAGERVKALVLGSIAIAAIQGVIGGLGWWILGLPNPLLWGLVMFLLELVPLLGSFLVLLPAAVWSASQGDWVAAIGLLVLNFVAVGLVDDWLRAWLVGRWSHIDPALILVGVVGGISTMGFPGILLGPLLMGLLPLALKAWSGEERPFAREERDRGEKGGGRARAWARRARQRLAHRGRSG